MTYVLEHQCINNHWLTPTHRATNKGQLFSLVHYFDLLKFIPAVAPSSLKVTGSPQLSHAGERPSRKAWHLCYGRIMLLLEETQATKPDVNYKNKVHIVAIGYSCCARPVGPYYIICQKSTRRLHLRHALDRTTPHSITN